MMSRFISSQSLGSIIGYGLELGRTWAGWSETDVYYWTPMYLRPDMTLHNMKKGCDGVSVESVRTPLLLRGLACSNFSLLAGLTM